MEMSSVQTFPSVDVIRWTDTDFWVRCPYCEEIHRHGFVSYESGLREGHCGFQRPSYRYNFPVAYEIDKVNAQFINICTIQDSEEDSDDTVSLSNEFSNMALSHSSKESHEYETSFDDSMEMITFPIKDDEPFKTRRIDCAISNCVNGDVHRVKLYLKTSSEASIFLRGRDRSGDTSLIMAAREKNADMISLLLEHGAEVNATNRNGRSALMEASLWGRLENTKLLLSQGADRYLCDDKNRGAFDLAQPTRKNRKERHTKAGGIWGDPSAEPVYKEDVLNRDADRREIARILGGTRPNNRIDSQLPVPDAAHHSFWRSSDGRSIIHCGPVREYPIPQSYKIIALLERGSPFPVISAMSGWGHRENFSISVSGKDWTERVLKIAAIVGHTLSTDPRKDQRIPGQFQASHAEKQLIAYFLDRHVFLPEDHILDTRFDEEIARLDFEIEERADQYPIVTQFYQLQREKRELDLELSHKDDRLPGDEYNENIVEQLKSRIATLDKQIASLDKRFEVKAIRARETQIEACERRKKLHGRLNRISNIAPKDTLSRTTILISAPTYRICEDCLAFKDCVNRFLNLSIELHECTK
ncbi:DYW family of nucleic acid deaminases-domain-containing protein [Aspergillus minisclerotigenes]|uniref:DYW family of nucleic acid deaminases-domain-containing protein n=1 Tax=Aspergillus minisclerotigenes TaxID=656917 RepID=A0A5N6IYM3_9EURO|nr:DYW family of nucleic acid deaminases-domain-containing protein [Aspergillus minisclerotigenes]